MTPKRARNRLKGSKLDRLKSIFKQSNASRSPSSPSANDSLGIPAKEYPRPGTRATPEVVSASTSAAEHLCLAAKKAAVFIIRLSLRDTEAKATRHLMQRIATRLWVLSVALELVTNSAIANLSIEEEAAATLLQIRKIFLRRDPSNTNYKHIADQIVSQIGDFDRKNLESVVISYFKISRPAESARKPSDADNLDEMCHELTSKVTGGWNWTGDLPSGIKAPNPNKYPRIANKKLFEALAPYTMCNQLCRHFQLEDHEGHGPDINRHPTRLPLGGPFKVCGEKDNPIMFEVIISSLQDTSWTQFHIGISRQVITHNTSNLAAFIDLVDKSRKARFADADLEMQEPEQEPEPEPEPEPDSEPRQHILCPALRELGQSQLLELTYLPGTGLVQSSLCPQPTSGLYRDQGLPLSNAIKLYTFSVRDKIFLAHTVAQAFWQLYASDFMRCVWTSDNVWFMQEDNYGSPKNELPMKAYICFDFGPDPQSMPEFLDPRDGEQTHRCPHILALGILLLKIAVGPVERKTIEKELKFTDVSHVTDNHVAAHGQLTNLQRTEWDGFTLHMSHFIKAIGHCLDSRNIWQNCKALSGRRELLYDKVVKPLAWLAAAFHENGDQVTYPYKDKTYLERCPHDEKGSFSASFEPKKALFGPGHSDGQWVDDFKTINGYLLDHVTARQEKIEESGSKEVQPPIKIAILDTGCNVELGFFKTEGRKSRIKWKDWVEEEPDAIDEDGHGSFMTQLAMTVAPLAEIYVVRVAKNSRDLDHENPRIKQAILWAGLDKDVRADIISMSFAFEAEFEDIKDISDVIDEVHKKRDDKVLFLAAAGNFGDGQEDMFPARHKDVIPIHAARSNSVFLKTDPKPMGTEDEFGTIGGDLPANFTREIAKVYPELALDPGSSIATAVAAGVMANTLIHADLLPYLDPPVHHMELPLQRLRMKPGMERILKLMVKGETVDHKRRFFNPVWLWKSNQRAGSAVDYNIGIAMQCALMTRPFP